MRNMLVAGGASNGKYGEAATILKGILQVSAVLSTSSVKAAPPHHTMG